VEAATPSLQRSVIERDRRRLIVDRVPLDQLERQLEEELSRPALVARFADWSRRDPALASFRRPAEVLRFLHSRPSPLERDAVLRALIARASTDAAARYLVLRALLPGLKNVVRRLLIDAEKREELWATVLCCAWERICSYSVERRPSRIAANVLLDTMRATLAEVQRSGPASEPLVEPIVAADGQHDEGDVDELLRAATAAGAITAREAELVLVTRFDGVLLAHVAAAHGEPYNRVKVRRQRAERRLLVWLGYRPVPRGQQKRHSSGARVAGAGHRPDRRFS
jgi:DNA-directed RNA polymerase specialized sigma24 family protein